MILRTLSALAATGALAACAWGPGTGFATLGEASLGLAARLPAGRLDEAGRWKTNNGWRVALDGGRLGLQLAALALEGEASAPGRAGGGGGTFDPANPPPGYGLCHGGHCHRDDGALIDYADIQAELDGRGAGASQPTTLVRLAAPGPAQALVLGASQALSLGACEPHCHLPQTTVAAVALGAVALEATGAVAPAAGGSARRFTLRLPLAGLTWRTRLAAPVSVSVGGPARLRLEASWALPETLFDDLPWEALHAQAAEAPVALEADVASRDRLQDHLREVALRASLRPLN
ncbi:MAG: hypothetical protein VKS61_09750 [Candidatus Sericytochromatia bacterium]|nr:hypothetical protein [Candidatus Sericytochromatia bacterium]